MGRDPDLLSIQEIKQLLPDVRRLEREVSALHSDVKRIPFPMDRPSLIPISILSGPEWSSKGDKGFNKGDSFSSNGSYGRKGFGGGSFYSGSNHGSGSFYVLI